VLNVVHLERRNARNFKDCERTVIELKAIVFNTLFVWVATYNCSHFYNFLRVLDLCFSSASLFLLYTTFLLGLCSFASFYEIKLHL
jgi:hypothetical protein